MSRLCGGAYVASFPSIQTSPESGCTKPAIIISIVVLPEPDGPRSVRNSPSGISMLAPPNATTGPYVLRRLRILSFGCVTRSETPPLSVSAQPAGRILPVDIELEDQLKIQALNRSISLSLTFAQ